MTTSLRGHTQDLVKKTKRMVSSVPQLESGDQKSLAAKKNWQQVGDNSKVMSAQFSVVQS